MSVDCSSSLSAVLPCVVPSLSDLASFLREDLAANFETVTVDVVTCPDLSSSPFSLSSSGFGHSLRIAEVGGPGNLFPAIHKEKHFDINSIACTCGLPCSFVFGPGAGPWPVVGVNCEMVADVNTKERKEQISSPTFSLMANLAISETTEGAPVVHIHASKRKGPINFPESIRQSIVKRFPGQLVSLGGVFILRAGKAKLHVMPDFPGCGHFDSEEQIGKEWLKFFEMRAPLTCTTVMHSNDAGHKLRLEHTHCFSEHGDAGHYHYDTTPEEVEYEAWFAPAETVYRIDEI